MKALVYTGPETVELQNVAAPVANDGEVVIQVEAVGICGSDMHAYLGHDARRPAPLILGHEAAGTVAGTGERVTVNPLVTCSTCPACVSGRTNLCPDRQIISMPPREGAFAEQFAIPRENLVAIPDGVSAVHAAMAEPLACGHHGVKEAIRLLRERLSDVSAVVLGGGAIGVGAALSLSIHGCRDVTLIEPSGTRHAMLRSALLAEIVSDASSVSRQPQLIIDAYGGARSREAASALVAPGGVIVHIGLADNNGGIDARRATLQEITFIGTYTYTAEDFRETAQLIFDGRYGDFSWLETRPLNDGPEAFRQLRAGEVAAAKVVLIP